MCPNYRHQGNSEPCVTIFHSPGRVAAHDVHHPLAGLQELIVKPNQAVKDMRLTQVWQEAGSVAFGGLETREPLALAQIDCITRYLLAQPGAATRRRCVAICWKALLILSCCFSTAGAQTQPEDSPQQLRREIRAQQAALEEQNRKLEQLLLRLEALERERNGVTPVHAGRRPRHSPLKLRPSLPSRYRN